MDIDTPILSAIEARIVSMLIGLLSLFFLFDLADDASAGAPVPHLAVEFAIVATSVSAAFWLWRRSSERLRLKADAAYREIHRLQVEADRWKSEAGELLRGLGAAVDVQFSRWSLTEAERDVALFLLKGLSYKEIANVRNVAERTVRDQCSSVYAKANLEGRAQFAAFFLEDILLPHSTN